MAVCIGNWINKRNYPYALILYILLVMWWRWAVECLCLICEFYLLVGMVCILLLTCPVLCDSMDANKY